MIPCVENSVLPFDETILSKLREKHGLEFDPLYEKHVGRFHGGVPLAPYVEVDGLTRRVGWFVALLDHDARLPGPFQRGTYNYEIDTRIDDRSIPALIDYAVDYYFFAERLIPFAALYTDGQAPTSLQLHCLDWHPADSLCFDRATSPMSIVHCRADAHVAEFRRIDDLAADPEVHAPVRYDSFCTHVAESFEVFCRLLKTAATA